MRPVRLPRAVRWFEAFPQPPSRKVDSDLARTPRTSTQAWSRRVREQEIEEFGEFEDSEDTLPGLDYASLYRGRTQGWFVLRAMPSERPSSSPGPQGQYRNLKAPSRMGYRSPGGFGARMIDLYRCSFKSRTARPSHQLPGGCLLNRS